MAKKPTTPKVTPTPTPEAVARIEQAERSSEALIRRHSILNPPTPTKGQP